MNNWSTFQATNLSIQNNSETPYISEVQGTAIIGQVSPINIIGKNFISNSQIVCSAGTISDIQRSPELISFNSLATSPGSFLVEIRNGSLSSEDWNNQSAPILIARNGLNLTNGWLDFRSVNPTTLGAVTSHINQSLTTKTFANSGYVLDSTNGLKIGASGSANNYNNFIRFDNFTFPLENCSYAVVTISDTTVSGGVYPWRVRNGIGSNSIANRLLVAVDFPLNLNYVFRPGGTPVFNDNTSAVPIASSAYFASNSIIRTKIIWDFSTGMVSVFLLNDLTNLDSGNLIYQFPINLFKDAVPPMTIETPGNPFFQFYNPNSLSSVIALKIN